MRIFRFLAKSAPAFQCGPLFLNSLAFHAHVRSLTSKPRKETQRARECLGGMTRGKQKIEAQRRNAERNQKAKGSQLEARAVGLKVVCPICKVQLANQNQLGDHYASKHPKEKPPTVSS